MEKNRNDPEPGKNVIVYENGNGKKFTIFLDPDSSLDILRKIDGLANDPRSGLTGIEAALLRSRVLDYLRTTFPATGQ